MTVNKVEVLHSKKPHGAVLTMNILECVSATVKNKVSLL